MYTVYRPKSCDKIAGCPTLLKVFLCKTKEKTSVFIECKFFSRTFQLYPHIRKLTSYLNVFHEDMEYPTSHMYFISTRTKRRLVKSISFECRLQPCSIKSYGMNFILSLQQTYILKCGQKIIISWSKSVTFDKRT